MACFVVPMAEAIVMTIVQKSMEKKEKKSGQKQYNLSTQAEAQLRSGMKFSWSRKLGWLNKLLWGGVLLLAVEHVWHGEVVPWPPFLTAMNNPADIGPMLHEIATIGTGMAVFVTAAWAVFVAVVERRAKTSKIAARQEG